MAQYLEFKDEKSSKFWMIDVDGNTHTVTYGKIGTDGRAKTKEFDSAEAASKDARKLLKSKLKKGYKAAATSDQRPDAVLTKEDAASRYDLGNYDPMGNIRYGKCVVFEGDVELRGDLTKETASALFFEGDEGAGEDLIIIDGDLTIDGGLELTSYYPHLLVRGDLRCEFLTSVDGLIQIDGDAFVEEGFIGNYNDGSIEIAGTTHVPFVFNGDHFANLNLNPKTVCINYYSYDDDFFEYAHYADELPDLLDDEYFEFFDEDREDYDFEWWSLKDAMRLGFSPFKPGKAPDALTAQDIRNLAADKAANPTTDAEASDAKPAGSKPSTPHEAVDLAVAKLAELHERYPDANLAMELATEADEERLSELYNVDSTSFQWQRLGRWREAKALDDVPSSSFDYLIERYGSLSWFLPEEAEDLDDLYTFRSNGHAGPTTPLEIMQAETYPLLEELAKYEDEPDYLKLKIFMSDEECNGYAFDTRFTDDAGEHLIVWFEGHDGPALEGEESDEIQPFGYWLLEQVNEATQQLLPWFESEHSI